MAKAMMISTKQILLTYLIKNYDGKSIDIIHNRSDFQCAVFAPIPLGIYRHARTTENVCLDMLNGSGAIIHFVDSDIDSGDY